MVTTCTGVGGFCPQKFVATTHRDLLREVAEGRFREDLAYRIRVATIVVPPLRVRLDDVPLLLGGHPRPATDRHLKTGHHG